MTEHDTLGRAVLRIPVTELMTVIAQRAKADADAARDQRPAPTEGQLVVWRILFWIAAGACALTAAIFSGLHWADEIELASGAISWMAFAAVVFLVGAGHIGQSIHQRRTAARLDEARTSLRDDIRDHAPADATELARIATLVQQVALAAGRQAEELKEIRSEVSARSAVSAEAFAAGVAAAVEAFKRLASPGGDSDALDAELRGFLSARLGEIDPREES